MRLYPSSLQGLRVLVVGMARSGRSAAALCRAEGAAVTCADLRTEVPPVEGCRMALGAHHIEDFVDADLIVVSPGVPACEPHLAEAAARGVPVIGELALAASRLSGTGARALTRRMPMIAITGTNGKSTVTHFCGALLEMAGLRPFVGGNFGRPLCEALLGVGPTAWDAAVVEVSSYQLEWPGEGAFAWRPDTAAILNLTPDHLARHGSLEAYAEVKCRLFDRMRPEDPALIPADDPLLARLSSGRGPRLAHLGLLPGAILDGDGLRVRLPGRSEVSLSLRDFGPPGIHNRWNAAAACFLTLAVGVEPERLRPERLGPLGHRLEAVGVLGGATWINDSKATNVAAAQVGLRAMAGPFVLLLGGQGKAGEDYGALRADLGGARAVVCFGESGPRIAEALTPVPTLRVGSMFEALELARQLARPGDAVLLSPACASFDEFRDFEHRGERFRAWVDSRLQEPPFSPTPPEGP